jgi:lipid-A-disaccharide synthase
MRRTIDRLLCIFPFEEKFFRSHAIQATYIGHPLSAIIGPSVERAEFLRKHRLPRDRPLVAILPGSRRGEAARHLPALVDAAARIYRKQATSFILPASVTAGAAFFRERISAAPIQVIEGQSWDAIAHCDLALAASGTVTVEAALLGTPMVTYYRVTGVSWMLGKLLVRVPFYSMVNLVAGRQVVPELMQSEMTGDRIAREALRLLNDGAARERMRADLAEVARKLTAEGDAIKRAATVIEDLLEGKVTHVS